MKKILIGLIIIVTVIVLIYLVESVYLTIRLTKLRVDRYNDVPYIENDFISQVFYDRLADSVTEHGISRTDFKKVKSDYYIFGYSYTFISFNKAFYCGDYSQKFEGLTDKDVQITFGSEAETYVEMVFTDFQWKVIRVWEDP
jgi:hypothetical protein